MTILYPEPKGAVRHGASSRSEEFDARTRIIDNESTTRRQVVGSLLGGAVAVGTHRPRSTRAAAQDSAPDSGSVPPVIQEWAAAWSVHDGATTLPLSIRATPPTEEVPSGTIFQGPQEIGGVRQSHFAAFPDVALELTSAFAAGDWAAAEWVYAGTYSGSLPGYRPAPASPSRCEVPPSSTPGREDPAQCQLFRLLLASDPARGPFAATADSNSGSTGCLCLWRLGSMLSRQNRFRR